MSDPKRAVVIGASSGVGRAVADELARQGYDLVISARDEVELEANAADLRLRHQVAATPLPLDLTADDEGLADYVAACRAAFPTVDVVLIPAGTVDDDDDGIADWDLTSTVVTTNFLAITKVAGQFVEQMQARGQGTVVLFSSIAAASPRRRNVAYGAAKAALEYFGRAMQHRLAGSRVRVQIYALGYVDTAMTRGRKLPFRPADPHRVARAVVKGLGRRRRFRYQPRYWRIIVTGLRLLPWTVYRRLKF